MRNEILTDSQWAEAREYLVTMVLEYLMLGWPSGMALFVVLGPLVKRYESGERTQALYDEIMALE